MTLVLVFLRSIEFNWGLSQGGFGANVFTVCYLLTNLVGNTIRIRKSPTDFPGLTWNSECGGVRIVNRIQNGAICDVNVFQLLFGEVKTNPQLVCLPARGWLRNCERRVTDRNGNLRWDAGDSPDSLSTSNIFILTVEYRLGISLEPNTSKSVVLTLNKMIGFCLGLQWWPGG